MQLIHSLIINEGQGHWRIGKVLSDEKDGMYSLSSTATGPEKVKSWNYWNGGRWITTPNDFDIADSKFRTRVTISLGGMYYIDMVSNISKY